MNKKATRIILTTLTAVFILGTALMPTVTMVFAAEQTSDQEQPAPAPPPPEDAPKDGDNGHSGHDMHDMKNM